MRVAVTGSAGKVGRRACAALEHAGHGVTRMDRRMDPAFPRGAIVDFTDFGEVMGALSGLDLHGGPPDAVVHLAALAAPGAAPDHVVFGTNMISTYNVFSACARLGIARVVWASSETLYGVLGQAPDYLPIDEDHPVRPEWSYALGKMLCETMADTFVRWQPGLSIASLRVGHVYEGEDYRRVAAMQADVGRGSGNLWNYVDAQDVGEACRLAAEAAFDGHERLIIAAGDTLSDRPSAELAAAHVPGVPSRLAGHAAFLSSARAARVIGYAPRFSWRDRTRAFAEPDVGSGPTVSQRS